MAPTPPAQADGTEVGDTGSIDDGDSSDGEETGGMSVPVMVFWILCLLLAADILSIILVSMNIRRERMLLEEEREERRNGRRQELNRTARSAPSGAEQGFQTEHIQPKAVSGGKIAVGQLHNIGKRPYQEDSSGVTMLSDGALAIVADGMGGLSGGDKVSQKIVYTMLGYSDSLKTGQMDGVLSAMVNGVNESVNKMLGPDGLYKSGSTLMAVLVRQNRFHWIAVGDSHIYFYRNGSLVQLNQEHNRGQDLIVKAVRGEITFQEAREDRKKSGLTSFVGMGNLKHVDKSLRSIPLEAGDRIVLMTDGVFNALPDQTIAAVLARNPNVDQAAAEMERLVIQHGNPRQDNFTAVILGF